MTMTKYILGSHNTWSYLPVRRWWMRPIKFMAKCQSKDFVTQFLMGVQCFDLRVRFDNGRLVFAHGIVEYKMTLTELVKHLKALDNSTTDYPIYVRVIHEVRNKKQYEKSDVTIFAAFCKELEERFTNLHFFGGNNLYNWQHDYTFSRKTPTCCGKYASVDDVKLLNDWWPWLYARFNNRKNLKEGTGMDILMIDYINIR